MAPRADDVVWRLRVAKSARLLVILLLLELAIAMLGGLVEVAFLRVLVEDVETAFALRVLRVIVRVALAAVTVAQARCAWLLTAPRPSARIRESRPAWALRCLAVASAVLSLLAIPFPNLVTSTGLLGWLDACIDICLKAAGLWYVSALFRELGLMKRARTSRNVALVVLLAFPIVLFGFAAGLVIGFLGSLLVFACLVRGLFLIVALRKALEVSAHEWWVDVSAVTNPIWASFVTSGAGRAEVMLASGERVDFLDRTDAELWLEEGGFVEGERAISRGLTKQLPESPLTVSRMASQQMTRRATWDDRSRRLA